MKWIIVILMVTMTSCAQLRPVARTAVDIAKDLCALSAQKQGFDPRVLCVIPAVLDVFLSDAQASIDDTGPDAMKRVIDGY